MDDDATFDALLTKIAPEIDLIEAHKPAIILKMGFPPKEIPINPDNLLRDANFGNRERIIVEVNQEMLEKMMVETLQNDK